MCTHFQTYTHEGKIPSQKYTRKATCCTVHSSCARKNLGQDVHRSLNLNRCLLHVHLIGNRCLLFINLRHLRNLMHRFQHYSDISANSWHHWKSLKQINKLLVRGSDTAFPVTTKRPCSSLNRASLSAWSSTTPEPWTPSAPKRPSR